MPPTRFKIFLLLLLSILSFSTYADDLRIADDFKEGDILSAETFNQIFDTIERINRKITDADLFGTWTCSAMKMADGGEATLPTGWINEDDLAYEISGTQVNFTQTISGTVPGVNAITTSAIWDNTADEYPKPQPISKTKSLELTLNNSSIFAKILGSNKYLSFPKKMLVSP